MPCSYLIKFPLQGTFFPFRQKWCTLDGTPLSHLSINLYDPKRPHIDALNVSANGLECHVLVYVCWLGSSCMSTLYQKNSGHQSVC